MTEEKSVKKFSMRYWKFLIYSLLPFKIALSILGIFSSVPSYRQALNNVNYSEAPQAFDIAYLRLYGTTLLLALILLCFTFVIRQEIAHLPMIPRKTIFKIYRGLE